LNQLVLSISCCNKYSNF